MVLADQSPSRLARAAWAQWGVLVLFRISEFKPLRDSLPEDLPMSAVQSLPPRHALMVWGGGWGEFEVDRAPRLEPKKPGPKPSGEPVAAYKAPLWGRVKEVARRVAKERGLKVGELLSVVESLAYLGSVGAELVEELVSGDCRDWRLESLGLAEDGVPTRLGEAVAEVFRSVAGAGEK